MNLLPLVTRLETLRLGRKGETLFLHMMPPGVASAILLRAPLAGTPIDHELPGYYRGEFQVIVRSPDVESGLALMKRVMEALTFKTETTIGTQFFRHCLPRHLPVAFPLSEGALIEHSVSFDCAYNEG